MMLVLLGLAAGIAAGEDESAAELYGKGVHAYFAADYDQAIGWLTESIAKFDGDPRAYYFRGLATASQSGVEAGLADFNQGADVEINRTDRPVYNINGALQRVQGSLRLELEKVRTATRQAASDRQKKRNRIRYEELKRRDDVVLFKPNRPAPQADLELPKPDLGGAPDPFASGLAFSGGKQVALATPVAATAAAETPSAGGDQPEDPFAEPAAGGATAPAEETDPFAEPGMGADSPGKSKPEPGDSTPPKAEDDSNPFGSDLPKLDLQMEDQPAGPKAGRGAGLLKILGKTLSGQSDRDPFGDAAPADEPATDADAKKPAADEPPATDPFADDEKKPEAGVKPADAGGDPFDSGDAKSDESKKPADAGGDPFDSGDAKSDETKKPADAGGDPFK
jgi:hypothetical protein